MIGSGLVGATVVAAALVAPQFVQRPRFVSHPTAEYVAAPGTTRAAFSRTFINSHHMRAVEADAYDVLVIGDSVVLGWARIDQDDIATSLLAQRLGVAVGNISANSWGPPNQLGYVDAHGLFDARVVVVVWSSHDAADVPGVEPQPQNEPLPEAMDAAKVLIQRIRDAGAMPIVALHRETHELDGDTDPGYDAFVQLAESMAVSIVHLRMPREVYKDNIHPTAAGQRLLADQLDPAIRKGLEG